MLSSIHPLGERVRGNRWAVTASAYLVGSVVGGVVAGSVFAVVGYSISLVGPPGQTTLVALVAGGCLLTAALDLGFLPFHLPTVHRQVNEDWLNRYRGWVYGWGFGFQLGLGVITIASTAAVYLTFVLAALGGAASSRLGAALLAGTVVGASFGLLRALPVLVLRSTTPAQLRAVHRALGNAAGRARWVTVVGLAGVAVAVAVYGWRQQ